MIASVVRGESNKSFRGSNLLANSNFKNNTIGMGVYTSFGPTVDNWDISGSGVATSFQLLVVDEPDRSTIKLKKTEAFNYDPIYFSQSLRQNDLRLTVGSSFSIDYKVTLARNGKLQSSIGYAFVSCVGNYVVALDLTLDVWQRITLPVQPLDYVGPVTVGVYITDPNIEIELAYPAFTNNGPFSKLNYSRGAEHVSEEGGEFLQTIPISTDISPVVYVKLPRKLATTPVITSNGGATPLNETEAVIDSDGKCTGVIVRANSTLDTGLIQQEVLVLSASASGPSSPSPAEMIVTGGLSWTQQGTKYFGSSLKIRPAALNALSSVQYTISFDMVVSQLDGNNSSIVLQHIPTIALVSWDSTTKEYTVELNFDFSLTYYSATGILPSVVSMGYFSEHVLGTKTVAKLSSRAYSDYAELEILLGWDATPNHTNPGWSSNLDISSPVISGSLFI